MLGYTYTTEQDAINARAQAASHMGLPIEGGTTLYWVDYDYSELDEFYYIIFDDGLDLVLGEPSEFEITL